MTATIEAFKQAMRHAGVAPPTVIVPDGIFRCFHVEGDSIGSNYGWYAFHAEEPTSGSYGHLITGLTKRWSDGDYYTLAPEDKARVWSRVEDAWLKRDEEVAKIPSDCFPAPTETGDAGVSEGESRMSLFMSANDLLSSPVKLAYLINGLIEFGTTGQLFGPSGGGKTFMALDMALCVATGTPWNGQGTKQGLVLYLAGEGRGGLTRRVKAWMVRHGKEAEDLGLFHVSRNTVGFDRTGMFAVIAEIESLAEALGVPVALIVIDTLARHIQGDENSTTDMGDFIEAVDGLRSAFPGSAAIIVHHTGHGEGAQNRSRGSSALKGAMDFEILIANGLLTVTKMKDGELPPRIEFKLNPVEIGADDNGLPITSCTVEYGQRAERHQQADCSDMEKVAITALTQVTARDKVPVNGKFGALVGDWREAFYELRRRSETDVTPQALKKAFQRASASLIEMGIVGEEGHTRFLVSLGSQASVIQGDKGTFGGHVPPCPSGKVGGHGTHPYKGCPDVPLLDPSPRTPAEERDFSDCDPEGVWQ